jgi:signal transduction histidine kinase
MSFLIKNLLDYAQINSGNFQKKLKMFDLKKSIKKVMSISRKTAESKNLFLEVNFPDTNSYIVYSDEDRIM